MLILIVSLLVFLPSLTANAVEVNGKEAQLGQIITYEIHASGCTALIQAIDIEVTYDSTALEYVKDSISMPNLTGTLVNDGDKDSIKFNALSLEGFGFGDDDLVASMQFCVISDHAPYLYIKSDIRNFIDDTLTDHKDEYIYYLTLTEDEIRVVENTSERINENNTDTPSASDNVSENGAESAVSTSRAASDAESEVSSVPSSSGAAETSRQTVSSQVSVRTSDHPYGSNPHDDTVTAVASKPANYSVIFFAAAGMLLLIAIIAVVFLITIKHSDGDKESDNIETKK